MSNQTERDDIRALRRLRPDIHIHFTYVLLPALALALPELIVLAQSTSTSTLTPTLLPDHRPWPKVLTHNPKYPLKPSDYTLMTELETLLLSKEINPHANHLHICNYHPTVSARHAHPQHEVSFQIAPKMKAYQ